MAERYVEVKLKKTAVTKVIPVNAVLLKWIPEELAVRNSKGAVMGLKSIGRKQIYSLPQKLAVWLIKQGIAEKK